MIRTLTVILAVQVALAAVLFRKSHSLESFKAQEPLLNFAITDIDRFSVEEKGENKVSVVLKDQKWVLGDQKDFPASAAKVSSLAETLFGLKRPWPVATTAIAAKKLKVTPEEFERRVSFFKGDQLVKTVYLGSAPAYRKVHARVDGESDVYVIEFEMSDADPKLSSWYDQDLTRIDPKNMVKIIFPDFTLKAEGENWILEGLTESEQLNQAKVRDIVSKVSLIRFSDQLGTDDKEEYGMTAAAAEYSIEMQDGSKRSYRFGPPYQENFSVLKVSNSPFYLKVAKTVAEGFKEYSRAALVTAKAAESSAPAEGDAVAPAAAAESAN